MRHDILLTIRVGTAILATQLLRNDLGYAVNQIYKLVALGMAEFVVGGFQSIYVYYQGRQRTVMDMRAFNVSFSGVQPLLVAKSFGVRLLRSIRSTVRSGFLRGREGVMCARRHLIIIA